MLKAYQMLQVGRKFLKLNTDQKIQVLAAPLILLGHMADGARQAAQDFPKDFWATLKHLGDRE